MMFGLKLESHPGPLQIADRWVDSASPIGKAACCASGKGHHMTSLTGVFNGG